MLSGFDGLWQQLVKGQPAAPSTVRGRGRSVKVQQAVVNDGAGLLRCAAVQDSNLDHSDLCTPSHKGPGLLWLGPPTHPHRITFEELCGNGTGTVPPLGAADYMALAAAFHTVFISDVPQLSQLLRDETRRLITAIDAFYDHRVKVR
eukprot:SAG22_NODE_1883_length_3378_cov_3.332723_6_plen_147_part_00